MTISDDKHRFVVIIDREIYEQLKMLAAKDSRSASNLAAKVLADFVKENSK